MSLSFPIELKTATSPGSVVISVVPAELYTEKKPGRERVGEKGTCCHPSVSLFHSDSLVSNGDGGGGNHNTWEWSFSIFNLKIILNT